jgi:hypothetical protein
MIVLTKRFKILFAIATAVGVYVFASSPNQSAADDEAVQSGATGVSKSNNVRRAPQPTASRGANSLTRLALRVTNDKSAGFLFPIQSWYIAPPPPPPAPVVQVKPPPPTAPPMPFGVIGSYSRAGDATVYFLTRGDRVFDVHIGDTLDNTYTVDSEAHGQLMLTYKPLNIQQALALGGSP